MQTIVGNYLDKGITRTHDIREKRIVLNASNFITDIVNATRTYNATNLINRNLSDASFKPTYQEDPFAQANE